MSSLSLAYSKADQQTVIWILQPHVTPLKLSILVLYSWPQSPAANTILLYTNVMWFYFANRTATGHMTSVTLVLFLHLFITLRSFWKHKLRIENVIVIYSRLFENYNWTRIKSLNSTITSKCVINCTSDVYRTFISIQHQYIM